MVSRSAAFIDAERSVRKEAFVRRLKDFLKTKGKFDVLAQPYGKPANGLRYTIIRLGTKKSESAQILTGTYEGKMFDKRTAKDLASGPIGKLKQILPEEV